MLASVDDDVDNGLVASRKVVVFVVGEHERDIEWDDDEDGVALFPGLVNMNTFMRHPHHHRSYDDVDENEQQQQQHFSNGAHHELVS